MISSKLFEKIILNNNVEISNRLTIAPLGLFASNSDGSMTDEEREYLKFRGTDIGLYILGNSMISKEGIFRPNLSQAICEKDIPALKERADIIKSQATKAIMQINHAGSFAEHEYTGLPPVVPSADILIKEAEQNGSNDTNFHELSDAEIKEIIHKFAYATELIIKAGYDGVEIHGANNFLIQQFYSPHTNKRTDNWGGSDEKRMNFALNIVDEVIVDEVCKVREKYKCPKFIIGYRLSPEESYEDGLTMTETLKLVKALVNKPLQYIHISQKNYFTKARRGEGAGVERLKLIHNETKGKMALIGVGGLRTENDLNSAVESEFSEFIAVGIASMLNKDFGILLKEGKGDKLNLEIDPEHPEKYSLPSNLWKMCLEDQEWLPPLKGKPRKKVEN